MGTKKGHKKGHIDDHFCDLFYDLFSMFIDGLSTFSSTQLADSNGHFTRVIYHFGKFCLLCGQILADMLQYIYNK